MSVKHKKVLPGTTNGNANEAQPEDWNDTHELLGMLALLDAATPVPDRILTIGSDGSIVLASYGSIVVPASVALTGSPTTTTPTAGDNSTRIANTAFVKTAIDNVIASAPGALNTLDELAAALGDDANYAATITAALALKAPLASPALTGNPTAPNQAAGTNNTRIANTAYADAAVAALSALIAAGTTASAGAVVNSSLSIYNGAHGGTGALIPTDDTVPLISEGSEIMSTTFTPKNTTNKLRITFRATAATPTVQNAVFALFAGSTCLNAQMINITGSNTKHAVHLVAEYTPGAVSLQTISVRAGGEASAIYVNGTGGGRVLGGASACTLLIEEIKA